MGKESQLCKVTYDWLLYIFNDDQYQSKRLITIRSTLAEFDMAEVWENQHLGALVGLNIREPTIGSVNVF